MRNLRLLVFLLAGAGASLASMMSMAFLPEVLRAQSPSLDSNCYFPQIGDPTEMDTIVGSDSNQDLGGTGIKNMGTKPDGSYGNMFIGNLSPTVALAQVQTGPNFNLHKLKASAQKLPSTGNNRISIDFCTFGHFRDQAHIDMFDGADRIYWADDNGNYDSTHFTFLGNNIYGDNGIFSIIAPFAGYFTSDTVEDIVEGFVTDYRPDYSKDTGYLQIFKGGASLYQKDTAFEDTSCVLFSQVINFYANRHILKGNFRGTGRDDLLIEGEYGGLNGAPGGNYGDFFFFANDPPFSLSKLAQAINFDTLMAAWQDSVSNFGTNYSTLAMPIFPKLSNDHSCDFLFVPNAPNYGEPTIYMFRGGPDFGSHRLTLDSAAFVITPPAIFGNDTWPAGLADAGDMTGTGNHVLYTSARNDFGDYWWDAFFVTGQALDDKIDIYNSHPYSEDPGDTLSANSDTLEDYLFSSAWPYAPNEPYAGGSLWLYYGSKNIPVHLNPQFADEKSIPQENGAGISLSPNPAQLWTVATIVWPVSEDGEYSIYDMLGRQMEHGPIRLYGGAEQQRIYFSGMAQGVYIYTIAGAHGSASARFVKLGGASGSTGASQPSIIQQMKDARDGKSDPAGLSASPFPAVR